MTEPRLERNYDCGLLVIHGLGRQSKGGFLRQSVDGFLGRMRADDSRLFGNGEGSRGPLQTVRSLAFEAGVDGAEKLEGLDVTYTVPGGGERSLLVLDGRWSDAYTRASPAAISAWVFRHEIPMLSRLWWYYARSAWSLAFAGLVLGLSVAAAIVSQDWLRALHRAVQDWPWLLEWSLIAAAVALVAAAAVLDRFRRKPGEYGDRARFVVPALVAGFLAAGLGFLIPFVPDVSRSHAAWSAAAAGAASAVLGGALDFRYRRSAKEWTGIVLGLASFLAVAAGLWAALWSGLVEHAAFPSAHRAITLPAEALGAAVLIALSLPARGRLGYLRYLSLGLRQISQAAFTYQRAVTLVVVGLGMLVLPVITFFVRTISGIPGLGLAGLKFVGKLEETIFVGSNFGDMHAFADSPARFARIVSAIEHALVTVEQQVKAGGTVTVLAHSGGAPAAWVLLTEPYSRRRSRDLRYRFVAVGAALNWAQHGFDEPDLPSLDGEFHNAGQPNATLFAHIYGTWDPVSHGPFFRTGAKLPPPLLPPGVNLPARNLGEPSLQEHFEYWANQEDVIPVVGQAVDPELGWVQLATQRDQRRLRGNARLVMVSVLSRVRAALFVAPLIATFMALAPAAQPEHEPVNLARRTAERINGKLGACTELTIAASQAPAGTATADSTQAGKAAKTRQRFLKDCDLPGPLDSALWETYQRPGIGNTVATVVLWLLVLGLLGAYRDLFWRVGGRTDASLAHRQHGLAVVPSGNWLRFATTWFGLGLIPALIWMAPVAIIGLAVDVNGMVYVVGLAFCGASAFADWVCVRTFVEETQIEPTMRAGAVLAKMVGREPPAPSPMADLMEPLAQDVGRAKSS